MGSKAPRVGDFIRIPLEDGRSAYAQYAYLDEHNGPVIQVFDVLTDGPVSIAELEQAKPLFGPVIVGLLPPIRSGRWQIVGHGASRQKTPPQFLMGNADEDGHVAYWSLWNGRKEIDLGRGPLPERYRSLEMRWVWPGEWVEERIATGTHPRLERLRRANPQTRPAGAGGAPRRPWWQSWRR